MNAGDTFLSPSPGSRDAQHLWIVITSSNVQGKCAIVNVTSYDPNDDRSCVLQPGDHPFVRHPSVVRYQGATIADAGLIERAIREGVVKARGAVSPDVLRRVQEGALLSKYTENGVKDAVRVEFA